MKKGISLVICICTYLMVFSTNKISCADAAQIASQLDHNTPTAESYTVVGYVTETVSGISSKNQQTFWMADTENGGQVFEGYKCYVPEALQVGDYVSVTGPIMRYNQIAEIKNGNVELLSPGEEGGSGEDEEEGGGEEEEETTPPATGSKVTISNPETWKYTELSKYVGQIIEFETPFYVCSNYSGYTISPRRIFQPTNQELPGSAGYSSILSLNSQGSVTLTGVSGYHRLGERLHNLKVKVNSQSSVSLVSCDWRGNTRADLERGYDSVAVNMRGEASIVVCTMNLEYYLVQAIGGSMGPASNAEHQKQRTKVSKALAKINADLYGFVEIEQGQQALAELAADLTTNTGRNFTYINDGGSANGTYTKAGFVYCSDVLQPYGKLRENNKGVTNRKKTQAFEEISTGERFLFSVNHFKAKSGSGSGDNADKKDGQGTYNGDRVREAQSVLAEYAKDCIFYNDSDILIMGDLNAYAKEDPIMVLLNGGMEDLHRAFHADSSYSYTYRGQIGYLDHALCNKTMYPQVTGMVAYHINSDESDSYTYDKSNDQTMFRCSDHDPVIVGLRLDKTLSNNEYVKTDIIFQDGAPCIQNGEGGYYVVYRVDGHLVKSAHITSTEEKIEGLAHGLYILNIYGNLNKSGYGKCVKKKLFIP